MGLLKSQRFSAGTTTFFAALILSLVLFSGQGAQAAGFGVTGNQVTITTNSASYTPTVNSTGLVTSVNAMQGTALESITIGLVKDGVNDGTYTVDLGIVVGDADNLRRIEAFLPGIQVVVAGSNTSVTVPAGSNLRIAGRASTGNPDFVTSIENLTANGPITAVNNNIVFSLTNLRNAILAKFGAQSGDAAILNDILAEGRYAYTVLVKSPNVPIGSVSGSTVTPFPAYNIGPASTQYGLNLSQIGSGDAAYPIASNTYLNGACYVLRGAYGFGTGKDAPAPGALPTANSVQLPPPTLTGISPGTGLTLGGEVVTITGTNFRAGITVSFGTVIANPASVSINSAGTQITCTAPAHAAGGFAMTVTNTDASSVTGLTYTYTLPAPYLSGISPVQGPAAGGTTVTLSGNHFVAGATVKFGDLNAGAVTVVNAGQITCTAPAYATGGPVAVTVTNPGPQTSGAKTYTYLLGPALTGVSPNTGSTEGGETVTLTGQRFASGQVVTFGGTAIGSYTVNTAGTQITLVTPAHAAGAVAVRVTDGFGQFSAIPNAFEYIQPLRADFSATPLQGAPIAGNSLTVQFQDNSIGTVTSRAWEFKNDTTGVTTTSAAQNPTVPFAATVPPTSYTVTVKLTVGNGTQTNSLTKTSYITIHRPDDINPPTAAIENGAPEGRTTNQRDYSITVGGMEVVRYTYRLSQDGGANWGAWTPDVTNPSLGTAVATPITLAGLGDAGQDSITIMLQVRGTDDSNNWQTIANATQRFWKIDIKPPTELTLSGVPQEGSTIAMDSISVRVGGSEVAHYKYQWNGGAWSDAVSVLSPITDLPAGNGAKTLDVIGADAYGNWQTVPTTRSWTVDNTVPTAVLTVDAATPINNGALVNIRNATFTVGGDSVTHYKYMLETDGVQGDWNPETPVATLIALTGLADNAPGGKYVLYVNARNNLGTWQDAALGQTINDATTYNWRVDATPPSDASGFAAEAGTPATTSVDLTWNAVESGLKSFRLRYATFPITAVNWDTATRIYTGIIPGSAGTVEGYTITGLLSNTTYYFGLRSEDQAGNLSLPAVVSITTTAYRPIITSFSRTDGGGTTGHNGIARELAVVGDYFILTESGTANTVKFISTQGAGGFSALSKGVTPTDGSDTLFVDVPLGAPLGTYKLQIVNANGTSPLSTQTYTVTQAPTPVPNVTLIYPVSGPDNATTDITITGSNFTGGTGVAIKSGANPPVALGNVVYESSTRITARVPSGSPKGIYEVQVTADPDGAGPYPPATNGVSATKFEVHTPVVLANAAVSTTQGVTMPGTGVVPAPVNLSTGSDDATSLTGEHVAEIGAAIEPGTSITMGGAPYTGTINPPRQIPLSSMSQQQQNKLGNSAVVFTMGIDDGTLLLGPGQTMFVKVEVATPSGGRKPTVYYLDTQTGEVARAGLNPNAHAVNSPYRPKIDWFHDEYEKPYHWGGTIISEQSNSPETGYTTYTIGLLLDHMSSFSAGAVMDITGVTPSSGTIDGGTAVTIAGANFQAGSTVSFDGAQATGVTVATDGTSIACTTPGHVEGAVNVVVTGLDAQTATLAGGFTYRVIPTITSIYPATGLPAGGTTVAITGTNFMPGVTVAFGDTLAPDVVSSPTLITCTTPAHAAGVVNVVVTNPNAEIATAANGFTYAVPVAPPTVPGDNQPITGNTTIPAGITITGNTISAGVTVVNNGTLINPTNNGVITGGILGGTISNTGTLQGITLAAGSTIDGGRITGSVTGEGTGATITNALIDAASVSNVTIGAGCTVTENTVDNNPGLDLTAAVTGPDGNINTATPLLVDAAGNTLTLAQLLETEINDVLGDATCNALDDVAGNTIISAGNLGNVVVPSVITSVVTAAEPDGVSFTESGELRIVENGIALILAPVSADEQSFATALQGIGLNMAEDSDQVVTISLPDGTRLVFRFDDFALRPGAVASIAAAGASFSLTGDPADPASYCLMITYPDGTTQKMPPFIHALGDFRSLARSADATYRIVPSSGVIELLGAGGTVLYRGRPAYFLATPATGAAGLTFEYAGDINGDGMEDLYMITPSGRQAIYSLPLN